MGTLVTSATEAHSKATQPAKDSQVFENDGALTSRLNLAEECQTSTVVAAPPTQRVLAPAQNCPTELLTPTEVAAILKVSTNTVISRFSGMAGVLLMPDVVKKRRLRERYRQIRIPRYVLDRFIAENTHQESTPLNVATNRKGMRLARAQAAMRSRHERAQ
jgi:hypothetical protein